eukprot:m.206200 g.206200  ORF g.206200 m.206200 type:complete len:193 (+) comp15020_c0_seq1:81-659(+)
MSQSPPRDEPRRSRSPQPPRRSPPRDARPESPQEDTENNKLYVGNLSFDSVEDDLRDEFGRFGRLHDVYLPRSRSDGRLRGFGFVTFAHRADAEAAEADMNGKPFMGRDITVNFARPRPPKSSRYDDYGRRGGRDRGYDRRDDRGYDRRDDRGYDRRDDRGYDRREDRGYDRGYDDRREDRYRDDRDYPRYR